MNHIATAIRPSTRAVRAGWVLAALVAVFMIFDGIARIVRFEPYVEALVELGYAERLGPWIGLLLVVCTVVYLVPRTAVLGAILLTGYLGGAVASQVRVEEVNFLFAAMMGALAWLALWLRDTRLRDLVPVRRD